MKLMEITATPAKRREKKKISVSVKRVIGAALALLFFAGTAFAAGKLYPIVDGGYEMYAEAFDEQDFLSTVADIREDTSFVSLDRIDDAFLEKLIDAEDHRFYYHCGIDLIALGRAFTANMLCGRVVEGGSTITQQLCKNLFFSHEQTYERKVAEVFTSFRVENLLTKDEILELYCNIIYFGEDCYGISEASYHYFGVSPSALTDEQATALVRTIPSPETRNPNQL